MKGQMNISFGVIFSIIIIIAIIATAGYVTKYFLDLNRCGEIGKFKENFEREINNAYRGSITQDTFEGRLPSGIEYVCFGDINSGFSGTGREAYEHFRLYGDGNSNLYMYPEEKACDGDLAYFNIDHVETGEFFCKEVIDGKVSFKIEKDSTDALVTVE